MGSKSTMTDVLIRRGNLDIDTHRRKKLQRRWEKMAIYEPRERSLELILLSHPMTLTRKQPCQCLDFRLQASRTVRKYISVVWATQSVMPYDSSPGELTHWFQIRILAHIIVCLMKVIFWLHSIKSIWSKYYEMT